MIPNHFTRFSGTGGGGKSGGGGETPFFCKTCGRTVPGKQVLSSVDVCKRCRVGNVSRGNGKQKKREKN